MYLLLATRKSLYDSTGFKTHVVDEHFVVSQSTVFSREDFATKLDSKQCFKGHLKLLNLLEAQ